VVDQDGLQGLAEVLDQMKAVNDLHGPGRAPANAVGIEVTPIAADHGDRRMRGKPGCDAGSRAIRQEVDDAMRQEIDQDGAIAMAAPPGPLVDTHGLQGLGLRHGGRPHRPEQRGWTGGEPQTSGEPGPGLVT
jgi:hypothetical protein